MKPPLVILASALTLARIVHAQAYDWTADPLPGVKINTVAFRGWIPAGQKPLRGTLVLVPGDLQDGRGMAADQRWQALARDIGFAVIACQFADGDPAMYQNDPDGEVAQALDAAVERLARDARHPELVNAPLAFWGTSAGSNVCGRYCTQFPLRVIAFASSKGTWGPSRDMTSGKAEIPMFFALGAKDSRIWLISSIHNIDAGLMLHAPWTVALQKNEGHEVGRSLDVAIPFLKAAINMRFTTASTASDSASGDSGDSINIFKTQLPSFGQPGAGGQSAQLYKIDIHTGWLGNPDTLDVVPYSHFKGDRNKAIWLPDQATALAWQQYLGN
ncbi:MAG: hypothetical protein ABSE62_11470 [Chthoniobacteraceae bacterium]|jgi:hypothetical protein